MAHLYLEVGVMNGDMEGHQVPAVSFMYVGTFRELNILGIVSGRQMKLYFRLYK